MTIRVGLIGAGRMGQVFAEQIAYRINEADLIAIANVSAEQVQVMENASAWKKVMPNLKFANDSVGNIDVSRNAVYGYDICTEVLGSEGGLMIGKMQQTPTLTLARNGVTYDKVPYFMERFGDAY